MPTLYNQSDKNTRDTYILITLFLLAVIGIGWVFAQAMQNSSVLWYAVIGSVAMSVGSYWFSDKMVLGMSGAREISESESPELYHLVQNLCITAGLPVPKIYIIDDASPNAFATGRDKNHAAIAFTRGILQKLDKSELEGVTAHELSHIGNRDILLATVVVVLVGIVALLADYFRGFTMWGGGRDENRGGGGIFLLIGLLLSLLAPLFAMLVQLAISRKREFLADADGALLTRYPEGLARALEKIAADPKPLDNANRATAHLFIANPLKGSQLSKLFMTHPPMEERVAALRALDV